MITSELEIINSPSLPSPKSKLGSYSQLMFHINESTLLITEHVKRREHQILVDFALR